MHSTSLLRYDYIFCGGGAAACLLLLRMHDTGLLQGKCVLIIDREKKNRRDKTFCFWSQCEEPIERELASVISHSWNRIKLPNLPPSGLEPMRYNHVSSLDLYQLIDVLCERNGWHQLTGDVHQITTTQEGHIVTVQHQQFWSKTVFDSRTPVFQSPQRAETHLHQSFVGWRIRLKNTLAHPEAFRFMDFDIDQQQFTQFVYVLPYADGSLLVEVTRFGLVPIQHEEAATLLKEYITRQFGDYQKIDDEHGCIPMSNSAIDAVNSAGAVRLGARNYAIKCSTGYAFKRMYEHANRITTCIRDGQSPATLNRDHRAATRGRFAFYDRLLLDILAHQPAFGKPIFERLFKHNSIQRILRFLDERSSLAEEVAIFSTLPLRPFMQALFRTISRSSIFRPLLLTLLCLLFTIVPIEEGTANTIATGLLIVGLAVVGIPHGAVDHLLENKQWSRVHAPLFIAKYLAIAALMGVVWYVAPTIALWCFLTYSAWHFGQADGQHWSMKPMSSLMWGVSVLTYIIATHPLESNTVLSVMGNYTLPFELSPWSLSPWILWFIHRRNAAGTLTVGWLMLSSQLPLLFAFGVYFIGQHSLTGWHQIQRHLRMSHKAIWIHALPFHAGAWFLLLSFYVLHQQADFGLMPFSWGHFFMFLACISLPHAWAMQAVYKQS